MKERLSRQRSYLVAIALILISGFSIAGNANAATPINRATVRSLRNVVQLILRDRSPRPAKVKDAMTPGDAVKTDRASMVELQFNDRSLARIGERALFQFLPNTRTFRLTNGTALLLIPPGQGTTRVRTPNAAAGIRGSALFVRYIPETDTTVVGALTNSGIEIFNGDQSQRQPIAAGQMAVVVKDRIERVYNFDLKTFYETSELVKDLELQSRGNLAQESDPAIAAVREETLQAIESQPITANNNTTIIQNPSFLTRPVTTFSGTASLPPAPLPGSPGLDRGGGRIFEAGISPVATPPALSFPVSPSMTADPGQTVIIPGASGGNPFGGPPGLTGTAPGQSVTNRGRGTGGPPGRTGGNQGQDKKD